MQKTKKVKLIAQHEFVLKSEYIEHPTGASLTVPDETMSIREILRKHVSGINMDIHNRSGYYEENPDHDSPDFEKLSNEDIFVRQQRLEDEKQLSENLKKRIDSQIREKETKNRATSEPAKPKATQGSSEADDDAKPDGEKAKK